MPGLAFRVQLILGLSFRAEGLRFRSYGWGKGAED